MKGINPAGIPPPGGVDPVPGRPVKGATVLFMGEKVNAMIGWLLMAMVCFGVPAPAGAKVIDRVVARVGSDIITSFDVEQALQAVEAQADPSELKTEEGQQKIKEARQQILDSLIDQKLVVQKARNWSEDNKKEGGDSAAAPNPYLPDDSEVEKRTDEAFQEAQSRYDSPEAFQAELNREHLTQESFRSKIREHVRDILIYQNMITDKRKEFQGSFTVGEDEARSYYKDHPDLFSAGEQVQLAQIVLPDDAAAEKMKQRLEAGADFASMAKRYSRDPSRFNGGMLGWIGKGQLEFPQLEKAAFAAKAGEVVGPIRTKEGWHLLKVLAFKQASQQTFAQVKNQVMNYLYSKKMDEKIKAWVQGLRQESYVQVFPGGQD